MAKPPLVPVFALLALGGIHFRDGVRPGGVDTEPPRGSPSGVAASNGYSFLANRGQWATSAAYVGRVPGGLVRLEPDGLLVQLADPRLERRGVLLRFAFEGSAATALEGLGRRSTIHSFFLGDDPLRWRADVGAFDAVHYEDLYPGIDMVVRLEHGQVKYDLLVEPGADLSSFRIRCDGAAGMAVRDGCLVAETELGAVSQQPGRTWEVLPDGGRRDRSCRFVERETGVFGLEVPDRDTRHALVIDPGLVWSTYLGGSVAFAVGDRASNVALDPRDGGAIVVGVTEGAGFPTTPGTFQLPGGKDDVFVAKLSGIDGSLVHSSVLGGSSGQEGPGDVAVDSLGRATVTGSTDSPDFPTTPGAFDTKKDSFSRSGFVLRLDPSATSLEYSTFLETAGGSGATIAVALTTTSSAVVVGTTGAGDFPTTPGVLSPTFNGTSDGYVSKLDPTGSALEWSTYMGGSSVDLVNALFIDEKGEITLTGRTLSVDFPTTPNVWQPTAVPGSHNAFVTRIDAEAKSLIWSTFLGGSIGDDEGIAVAVEPSGSAVVVGWTRSFEFPTTPGAVQPSQSAGDDGFVTRLDPLGRTLLYSTYLGSAATDLITGLAVDASGVATLVGITGTSFPTTPGAWSGIPLGNDDGFVARLHPSGTKLFYSSYFGGPGADRVNNMAQDALGRVTFCGQSTGGYPTTPGSASPVYNGGQTDATVSALELYLAGVAPHGAATPSCRGPLLLNATEMPAAGSPTFGVYCSGAPPGAAGFLMIGAPSPAPLAVLGVDLWITPARPWTRLAVVADAAGFVETALPLPAAAAGERFACQYLFRNTAACGGGGAFSASNALRVTVQ